MSGKKILTGIRANSNLHLGNYLGAILPMIKTQKELSQNDQLFFFIPDLHSFTTAVDHSQLYDLVIENVRNYVAAGLDYTKSNTIIYRQSHVSAHSELTWILSCFTYFGEMGRMIQFKEKSTGKNETVSVGLFTYPILQAADILLYNAEYVPVGEDQRQHLEIARDLAIRFNHKFEQDIFILPKPWKDQMEFFKLDEGIRIRSLQNPEAKMSKSVSDPKGTILLKDDPKLAAKKIMSAVTDTIGVINWDWEMQPGITNLLQILSLLKNISHQEIILTWTGKTSYGDLKKEVAGAVEEFLTSFQDNLNKFSVNEAEEVLVKGEQIANEIANETLYKAQKAVGLVR